MAAVTMASVVSVALRPAGERRRTGRRGAGSGVAAQAEAAADLAATDGGVDGPWFVPGGLDVLMPAV